MLSSRSIVSRLSKQMIDVRGRNTYHRQGLGSLLAPSITTTPISWYDANTLQCNSFYILSSFTFTDIDYISISTMRREKLYFVLVSLRRIRTKCNKSLPEKVYPFDKVTLNWSFTELLKGRGNRLNHTTPLLFFARRDVA